SVAERPLSSVMPVMTGGGGARSGFTFVFMRYIWDAFVLPTSTYSLLASGWSALAVSKLGPPNFVSHIRSPAAFVLNRYASLGPLALVYVLPATMYPLSAVSITERPTSLSVPPIDFFQTASPRPSVLTR